MMELGIGTVLVSGLLLCGDYLYSPELASVVREALARLAALWVRARVFYVGLFSPLG